MGTDLSFNFEKPIHPLADLRYRRKNNYTLGDGCYSYFGTMSIKLTL